VALGVSAGENKTGCQSGRRLVNHMARIVVKATPGVAALSGVACGVGIARCAECIRFRLLFRIRIGGPGLEFGNAIGGSRTVSLQTSERAVVKFRSSACFLFPDFSTLPAHTHTALATHTHTHGRRHRKKSERGWSGEEATFARISRLLLLLLPAAVAVVAVAVVYIPTV